MAIGTHYIINTDAATLGSSPHEIWFEHGLAFTGASPKYDAALSRLGPGSVVLMYANGRGVVGVGTVLDSWDRQEHAPPLVYLDPPYLEYRIPVDWHTDLRHFPISPTQLRELGISPPPRAVQRVSDQAAARLLEALGTAHPSIPDVIANERPPNRSETTERRIIRDTRITSQLKALHRHTCQLCGTRLTIGRGLFYSEGHHLQPLGEPHNGPDIAANVVIVCPNCHAQLDHFAIVLQPATIQTLPEHCLGDPYVTYHNTRAQARRTV